jgi:hypothetical protein
VKSATLVSLATLLVGCATSGVIPADRDTFLITKKNAGGVFGNAEALKGDLYLEASAFCREKGQQVETVAASHESAIPFVRMGGASLQFRCVPPKQ